ncbi:hypothetical protein QR680_017111 [Steinernema hermaphroditum]|uniref:SXP/RAL-2 family protein Ani s 5-like cation-binding domain-containing protein n=1 Tax=Steinernema hermaphroditum TaxID=289476 RepID=A0AA39LNJ0_9BILA|nr:hypothetical protein QR680_017111 [Steinernema hermaphroditum]
MKALTVLLLATVSSFAFSSEIEDLAAYAQDLLDNGALQKAPRVVYHHVPVPVTIPQYRYSSLRHYLDNLRRDAKIVELAKEHEETTQKLKKTEAHLEDFRKNVSRAHDAHKKDAVELASKMEAKNEEIAALHKQIEDLNAQLSEGHRNILQKHRAGAVLRSALTRLYVLCGQMHAKMMDLYGTIGRHFEDSSVRLEATVDGIGSRLAALRERRETFVAKKRTKRTFF